jgi:hypothetical protein
MQLSISEILDKASKMKSKAEKVKWLKQNEAKPLKTVLKATYCPSLKCLLPEGIPPYTPSEAVDDHGMLYTNSKRIPYFYEGTGTNVKPMKREQLFIQLLETVNKEDALLLLDMKDGKHVKGLTVKTINEAFPNLIAEDVKAKNG